MNLEENQKESNLAPEKLGAMIEKNFLTESGRKLARNIFLNQATETEEKEIRKQTVMSI